MDFLVNTVKDAQLNGGNTKVVSDIGQRGVTHINTVKKLANNITANLDNGSK